MNGRVMAVCGLFILLTTGLLSCADMGDDPPAPVPGSLTAVPASVTVGPGEVKRVVISGGTLPYVIVEAPDGSLATAIIAGTDTLTITGVTVASASGATSVKVKDNTPSPEKEVRIPITKVP